jgi:pilus biogenesis lipoprotein CpaD
MASISKKWLLLGFITSLSLMACSRDEVIRHHNREKHLKLHHHSEIMEFTHKPGAKKLKEEELLQVKSLLRNPEAHTRQSVHVTLPEGNDARITLLERFLVKNGVKQRFIHREDESENKTLKGIIARFDVYRVTPPPCPKWSHYLGNAEGYHDPSNLGCANQSNFVMMIDDPALLFRGEQPQPYDSVRETQEVVDYRARKELKIKLETVKSEQSG